MNIADFVEKDICVFFESAAEMAAFLELCEKNNLRWGDGSRAMMEPVNLWTVELIHWADGSLRRCSIWRPGYELVPAWQILHGEQVRKAVKAHPSAHGYPKYRIVIDCDGVKTVAQLQAEGRTVKVAFCKKHPEDEFSIRKAAEIALWRLFAKKEKDE